MIPTFYSEKMVADGIDSFSPSAGKPRIVANALGNIEDKFPRLGINLVKPIPVTVAEICRVHDPNHVYEILSCKKNNGFDLKSIEVAKSLPYTLGAMNSAARAAIQLKTHTAALCSGFHHASYDNAKWYCTFNGLMVAAVDLLEKQLAKKIAIIDADQHYGDGTQSIIDDIYDGRIKGLSRDTCNKILHYSFGRDFDKPEHARYYLARAREVIAEVAEFKPDVVLYQAGADAHVDDPLGGVLTTEELAERDVTIIGGCAKLGIPVAWNLAGGYKRDKYGGISDVVKIHLNTFFAAWLNPIKN